MIQMVLSSALGDLGLSMMGFLCGVGTTRMYYVLTGRLSGRRCRTRHSHKFG